MNEPKLCDRHQAETDAEKASYGVCQMCPFEAEDAAKSARDAARLRADRVHAAALVFCGLQEGGLEWCVKNSIMLVAAVDAALSAAQPPEPKR